MPNNDATIESDPDQFARELHRCLLTDGPRSPVVRRLMRIARKHTGAELQRILETKINEFRRHQRETRVPTLWNSPVRGWEWVCDHVALTPPRDVLMTLVYVVIAVLGIELFKTRRNAPVDASAFASLFGSPVQQSGRRADSDAAEADAHADQQFEDWLTMQIVAAAGTEEFAGVLRERIQQTLSDVDLRGVLRDHVESLDLPSQVRRQIDQCLQSEDFRSRIVRGVVEAVPSDRGSASPPVAIDPAVLSAMVGEQLRILDLPGTVRREVREALRDLKIADKPEPATSSAGRETEARGDTNPVEVQASTAPADDLDSGAKTAPTGTAPNNTPPSAEGP